MRIALWLIPAALSGCSFRFFQEQRIEPGTSSLLVRIEDEEGRLLPPHEVELSRPGWFGERRVAQAPGAFSGIAAGAYEVRLTDRLDLRYAENREIEVRLGPGETSEVRFVLRSAARIRVRVPADCLVAALPESRLDRPFSAQRDWVDRYGTYAAAEGEAVLFVPPSDEPYWLAAAGPLIAGLALGIPEAVDFERPSPIRLTRVGPLKPREEKSVRFEWSAPWEPRFTGGSWDRRG